MISLCVWSRAYIFLECVAAWNADELRAQAGTNGYGLEVAVFGFAGSNGPVYGMIGGRSPTTSRTAAAVSCQVCLRFCEAFFSHATTLRISRMIDPTSLALAV